MLPSEGPHPVDFEASQLGKLVEGRGHPMGMVPNGHEKRTGSAKLQSSIGGRIHRDTVDFAAPLLVSVIGVGYLLDSIPSKQAQYLHPEVARAKKNQTLGVPT